MKSRHSLAIFAILLPFIILLAACPPGNQGRTINIHVQDVFSTTRGVWVWGDVPAPSENWPSGAIRLDQEDEHGVFATIRINEDAKEIGFLFVDRDNGTQTGDIYLHAADFDAHSDFYFIPWETTPYISPLSGLSNVIFVSPTTVTATLVGMTEISAADISAADKTGAALTVAGASLSGTTVTITLSGANATVKNAPYKITVNSMDTYAAPTAAMIEAASIVYSGADLGWNAGTAKVWAPLASLVSVLSYTNPADAKTDLTAIQTASFKLENAGTCLGTRSAMTLDIDTGVWTGSVTAGRYYMYEITNMGRTTRVCDIYAKAASGDSVAAYAADISASALPAGWNAEYYNPWDTDGGAMKSYTEAVVFEMHIRDWSRAFASTSTGRYADITAALASGAGFYNHLRDLGVTHVQILPLSDSSQTNSDTYYGWGYNPYHYNVPEGRYASSGYSGAETPVLEMRAMIQAFHDAGIAVIMDVVYNHTASTGTASLYDMTVPKYYYRLNADGTYSNGSGCGNETASNTIMFRKYMIESLKHWMNDYHINGFRFDLMGLHETSTMQQVYEALSAIDVNVMVYGEPWTGGGSRVVGGVSKSTIDSCTSGTFLNGVACFNDDYRNGIKGAEFGGFSKGHVQGSYRDSDMVEGLRGSLKIAGGFTDRIGRSLNYVESHDNFTLFDKLAISYLNLTSFSGDLFSAIGSAGLTEVKKQDKLTAAFVLLSQGLPFINGGQEFLRSKQGNENSYNAADSINQVSMAFKTSYSDVYNVYKGLIALRRSDDAFTAGSSVSASTPSTGVTVYLTTGSAYSYVVYFNATSSIRTISPDASFTTAVDISTGAVTTSSTIPTSVPAKGFVILRK